MATTPSYLIGLDLGQAADFTACVALERTEIPGPQRWPLRPLAHYAARLIRRWPLGTAYTEIVEAVTDMACKKPLAGCPLVVDATGVGRPVVDLFRRQAGLKDRVRPVVLTAGHTEEYVNGTWRVAKVTLISTVQVLLQSRRLKFANVPETAILVKELQNYRVKLTAAANEVFSAREGEHDDLVLALALGCWGGERLTQGGSFRPYVLNGGAGPVYGAGGEGY